MPGFTMIMMPGPRWTAMAAVMVQYGSASEPAPVLEQVALWLSTKKVCARAAGANDTAKANDRATVKTLASKARRAPGRDGVAGFMATSGVGTAGLHCEQRSRAISIAFINGKFYTRSETAARLSP